MPLSLPAGGAMALDAQDVANIATVIGAPLAVLALCYNGIQLKRTLNVERGRFMLELRCMVARYDKIHALLRRGGAWHKASDMPSEDITEEWILVDDYMGFFEHCEYL